MAKQNKELVSFIKGLYSLIDANIELINAISILEKNYKYNFRLNIKKMKEAIKNGENLDIAFRFVNNDKEFISLINIAQETGNLKIVLKNLNEKYKFENAIKREILNLTIYPLTVIIVSMIVVLGMFKFVIPKFSSIYLDLNQEIPKFTKIIINISNFINNNFIMILIFNLIIFLSVIFLFNYKREIIDKLIQRLPILSRLIYKIQVLNFTQKMYMLTSTNVELVRALKICKNTSYRTMSIMLSKIIFKIENGKNISQSFKECNIDIELFDLEYRSYLEIGEKTGCLDCSFGMLKDLYYERLSNESKIFLKLFEPISILVIALIVGTIVLSVMLPILNIGNSIV